MAGLLYKSFPVTGTEDDGDDIKVTGKCSDGQLDLDGDIVDPGHMAVEMKRFISQLPAILLEHAPHPAGVGLESWQDPDGSTWLKSRVVDPDAMALVRQHRVKAYSVGLRDVVTSPNPAVPRYHITKFRLSEVSLVGSPSNVRCGITVCKSKGGVPRYVGKAFVVGDEHRSVLPACFCKACMDGRKRCGCSECSGVVKELKKSAKLAADPAKAAEKALRASMRAALDSSDPWEREAARMVLGGKD